MERTIAVNRITDEVKTAYAKELLNALKLGFEKREAAKKDGSWGSSYDVYADTVRFLSSRGESEQLTDEEVPF